MESAIHYIVKIKLIRPTEGDTIEFIESAKEFANASPIIAREKAFIYYQNYIDVLLLGKGKEYISDKEARNELSTFIESGETRLLKFDDDEIEISKSYGNGIGVFMKVDVPIDDNHYRDDKDEESVIHGIGTIGWFGDPQSLIDGLNHEFAYYEHYGYDVKDYLVKVDFYEADIDETESNNLLKTPFDWKGYDGPLYDNEATPSQSEQAITTIEELIEKGECNQIEFKPTLLYNFSTKKPGISIKFIIAKTICSFLNSNGGFLFIGVNDNGTILGLDNDFQLSENKNSKDFFQLEFDQMLEHFLTMSVKNNVVGKFYTLNNKEIYLVTVQPNKRIPIFLKGQEGKEFYIRGEASTRQLRDIEQMTNYCIDRFSNPKN